MNTVYRKYLKRVIDAVLSFVLLVLLIPLFLIIGLVIYFELGFPIFFCQKRIGYYGEEFILYKFRTMQDCDIDKGKKYVTKLTKLIRWFGLDEIPQLINILKGDMSLVGPRPNPSYDLEKSNLIEEYTERFLVRPGFVPIYMSRECGVENKKQALIADCKYASGDITVMTDIKHVVHAILYVADIKNYQEATAHIDTR